MSVDWNFPLNNNGQFNGVSDAGIETFKGGLFGSLAREICQNSLDAVKDSDKPVIVEFKTTTIKNTDILGYSSLLRTVLECHDFWSKTDNKKSIDFMNKCKDTIISKNINLLRISDFNTTGLTGSDSDDISPWTSLVKSSGISSKSGEAGGSFGIGKFAPFVCSNLRTIFYSTLDKEGKGATQGVSKLTSYKTPKGDFTQGTGYYGKVAKNTAIRETISLDSNYKREESGTDLFILGFIDDNNWIKEVAISIVSNFLLAIYNNKLIAKIGTITIAKSNLEQIIQIFTNDKDMLYAINYYKVLTSEQTIKHTEDFEGLGELELSVLFENGLHRRVLASRSSGMKIKDISNISSTIQFAGMLTLNGMELNGFFRAMENPAHDNWEPNRHPDPKLAKKYEQTLKRVTKNIIKELAKQNPVEELDAEGVGEFLPYDVKDINILENKNKVEAINDTIKDIEVKKVQKTKNTEKSAIKKGVNGTKISDDENGELNDFLNNSTNSGKAEGLEGSKSSETIQSESGSKKHYLKLDFAKSRLFYNNTSDMYTLIFSSSIDVNSCILKVKLSGEQSSIVANIVECVNHSNEKIKISGNKILIGDIKKEQKTKINFKVKTYKNCSLEVDLYGYEQ